MPGIDSLVLIQLFFVTFVVGDGVVPAADAVEEREVLSGNGVAKHEGGNAGGISPEGKGNKV